MRYSPGTTTDPPLAATFTTASGSLVDPTSLYVDVVDPTGEIVFDDQVPTRVSLGTFQYSFLVPEEAITGMWTIEWHAVVVGLNAYGTEDFEILEGSAVVTPTNVMLASRLRARLAESKVEATGDGSETFFTDDQISDLLSYAGDDLDLATLEGWLRKEARYQRLVDISESGAERKLSQRFRQAQMMVSFWSSALGKAAEGRSAALAGRVVGKVISLRNDDPCEAWTPFPFGPDTDVIRQYPTHRLIIPAILH